MNEEPTIYSPYSGEGEPDAEKMLKKAFPELEDLSKEFYEKNRLFPPTRTIRTHSSLILEWGELPANTDLVLLSLRKDNEENWDMPLLQPGFNDKRELEFLYTIRRGVYILEGILKQSKINLTTEVIFRERYKSISRDDVFMLGRSTDVRGIPSLEVKRIDSEPYWFLIDPRK
jgi:hypothetical protein